MSWNEPGGGNNRPRDPWGSNDQGPPDLDEALKKLNQQLKGLFGGGKGGSGSNSAGGGSQIPKALIAVVIAGVIAVWGVMGFYQIDEQERAVVLRFGEYAGTLQPGLQWNPPIIDEVLTVNTTKVRAASFPGSHADPGREHRRGEHVGAIRYRQPRELRAQRA